MAEHKAYSCDGGCDTNLVLDKPSDSLSRYGWWHVFTPDGFPTLYCCSPECLQRAVERVTQRSLTR